MQRGHDDDAGPTTLWRQGTDAAARSPVPVDGFDIDLGALAAQLGTPLHVYSAPAIAARIAELQHALRGLDALACYAVKANGSTAVLRLMADAGLGADIVSGGELRRALRAGIAASRIVFSGVGKSAEEIAQALSARILRFNVESQDELDVLQDVAARAGLVADASVRVNPDVDARTHEKISTGKAGNKFGVCFDEARRWFAQAARRPNVRLDGLHVHIGSQILEPQPFQLAYSRVAALWRELADAGHAIRSIDVGGGLGVAYRAGGERTPPATMQVEAMRSAFRGFDGRLLLEPGRWLVAEAGMLLTRVIRAKQDGGRNFLVVDAAMNDLQRPSLYDAWHEIEPLHPRSRRLPYEVVGPVCETSDTFARDRELPECIAGDLLLIRTTGAYGASMGSTYNSRPLAAEVLLDRGRYAVVRTRQTFEQMIAGESPAGEWHTT